jgi:hypothetical protein
VKQGDSEVSPIIEDLWLECVVDKIELMAHINRAFQLNPIPIVESLTAEDC